MDEKREKYPWRKSCDWNEKSLQDLQQQIENYQPLGRLKVRQANILLVGQIGTGKSSFFNTINSIFCGYISSQACSGSAEHSLTLHYRRCQVRNKITGKPLNFRLCDTRGLEGEDGYDTREILSLLEGNTPVKYKGFDKNEIISGLENLLASIKRLRFWNTDVHEGFRSDEEVRILVVMLMLAFVFIIQICKSKMESHPEIAKENTVFLFFLGFVVVLIVSVAIGLCTSTMLAKGKLWYKQLTAIPKKKIGEKIHCVAFVVDGSTVDILPDKLLQRIKALQSILNEKGLPQVALLTKIDKVSQSLTEDVSCVFHMTSIRDTVDKVAHIMGLPRTHVLPIKNYENEMQMDVNLNILALFSLHQMLHFADDFLCNHLDDLEENGEDNGENIIRENNHFRA